MERRKKMNEKMVKAKLWKLLVVSQWGAAHGNTRYDQVASEAGAMGYVVKPVAEAQIARIIETARERFVFFEGIRSEAADEVLAQNDSGLLAAGPMLAF